MVKRKDVRYLFSRTTKGRNGRKPPQSYTKINKIIVTKKEVVVDESDDFSLIKLRCLETYRTILSFQFLFTLTLKDFLCHSGERHS